MKEGAEELRRTAEEAARAAGGILRKMFRGSDLTVERKEEHDFVTAADRASEEEILSRLRRRFPDHRILTEEAGHLGGDGELEWVIDPLDGTTNFLEGYPAYGVSIACRSREDLLAGVVYDPEGENLWSAARGGGATWNGRPMRASALPGLDGAFLATGFPFKARRALATYLQVFGAVFMEARAIRRCGSAALDLAYTASGVFDGFFEFRLAPWDVAAGSLLIREAGGAVCDLDGGDRYLEGGNILAGGVGVLRELQSLVAAHASEALLDGLTGG